MPRLRCAICVESLLVEKFRFFYCGHGLCENCVRKTRAEPACAICRQPKGQAHQIFLDFSEPTIDERASKVADGLNRMDVNSPAVSLERAGRKLKDIIQYVDEDAANHLLEAVQNLNERVLPLSTMLELERADNAVYQKEIADLEAQLKQAKSLDANVTRLYMQLGDAEENYEKAASLAEKANRRAEARQEENQRLRESLERHRRALKNKDEEIEIVKAALEKKETKIHLLHTKLKALSKLQKRSRIQSQDPDASLLVESPIKDAEGMVDLEFEFDEPPQHRLKTRTNLANSQSKKRKLVTAVAVGG